jgi:hypothetical protein
MRSSCQTIETKVESNPRNCFNEMSTTSNSVVPPSMCSHQILFFDSLVIAVFAIGTMVLSDAMIGVAFLFTGTTLLNLFAFLGRVTLSLDCVVHCSAISSYWAARVARLPHAALKSVLVFLVVCSICAFGTFAALIHMHFRDQEMQHHQSNQNMYVVSIHCLHPFEN